MLVKFFAIFVQMRGDEIVGMLLHQLLSAESPISENTSFVLTAIAPAGVLTTSYGDGGSVCGGIHICWTGATSIPNVIYIRCLSHLMVTG